MNDRPHTGPLPLESENRLPSLTVAKVPGGSFAFRFDKPKRGEKQFEFRRIRSGQRLFPLLGGEGQGEGEREHKSFLCRP